MKPTRHLSLSVLMICVTVVAIALGVWHNWDRRAVFQKSSYDFLVADLTKTDAEAAIEHAAGCDRALIHVHLDWSSYAVRRERFAEFMGAYLENYPSSNLMFHYIDCTEFGRHQSAFENLDGWEEQGGIISGAGELVWLENGRVVKVSSMFELNYSVSELIKATNDVFPPAGSKQ